MSEPRKASNGYVASARVQRGKSWREINRQAVRLSRQIYDRMARANAMGDTSEEARMRARLRRINTAGLAYSRNIEETYGATYSPAGFTNRDWINTMGDTPLNYYSYTRRARTNRR